jgi:hypothetical protein
MSEMHRSEPAATPQSPAASQSEVEAARRPRPASLVEHHRECWQRGERLSARAELRETMAQWSYQGYHVQHNDALWAAVQIELYGGAGQPAHSLLSGRVGRVH